MPSLHFLGWERPTIELVAEKLEELNRANPSRFRRATVVVPTAESGRRLREYMAERAGKPLLMPRFTLAGQLIPTDAQGVATEAETLAAWLQVLGQEDYRNLLPHSDIKENERCERYCENNCRKNLRGSELCARNIKAIRSESLDHHSAKTVPTKYHKEYLSVILLVLIEDVNSYKSDKIPK
jgi:hypothetical protein